MTISEEIKVLPIPFRTALRPIFPILFHWNEDMSLTLIHNCPSVTRYDARIVWIKSSYTVTSVKSTTCSEKIGRIILSRTPCDCLYSFLGLRIISWPITSLWMS